jgi:hypothetical protein
MRKRCSPSCGKSQVPVYYGKGIRVCSEWESFVTFREWAENNGYENNLSIDRINGDGNYEPNNCRWATRYVQSNNSTHNRRITMNGETKTLKEWADSIGIGSSGLFNRIKKGWDLDRALTEKPGSRRITP